MRELADESRSLGAMASRKPIRQDNADQQKKHVALVYFRWEAGADQTSRQAHSQQERSDALQTHVRTKHTDVVMSKFTALVER